MIKQLLMSLCGMMIFVFTGISVYYFTTENFVMYYLFLGLAGINIGTILYVSIAEIKS